jgi:uncharacterized membrane protein/ribosomal protein L40E
LGVIDVTLESNRMLAGIGALLIVISSITSFLSLAQFFFPSLLIGVFGAPFGLLGLAGLILFMIAMKGFAVHYKDPSIFNNALYWILSSIIAGVVAVALSVAVVLSVLSRIIETMSPFTPANPPTLSSVLDALRPLIGYFIPVGIVVFAIMVLSVVFIMRAFNRLAAASGVSLFRTVGLMFLVGVALTGALGLLTVLLVFSGSIAISAILPLTVVSGLVSFVTWILTTIGFFRIRTPASQTFPQKPSQVVASGVQVKFCPRCGAENVADATYCTYCGQRF